MEIAKSALILLSAFFAASSSYSATTKSFDSPIVQANQSALQARFGNMPGNIASNWNRGAIDFSQVFGADFQNQDLRIILRSKDMFFSNSYGVEGSMISIQPGTSAYTGQEGYISFAAGDNLNFQVYSGSLDQAFDLFSPSQDIFAYTTTTVDTWYYDVVNGNVELVYGNVKTLLVGFEDTRGAIDWDYNDLVFAVQALPSAQLSLHNGLGAAGQPLPSVFATIVVSISVFGFWINRKRKKR